MKKRTKPEDIIDQVMRPEEPLIPEHQTQRLTVDMLRDAAQRLYEDTYRPQTYTFYDEQDMREYRRVVMMSPRKAGKQSLADFLRQGIT